MAFRRPTAVDAAVALIVLVLGLAEAASGQLDGPQQLGFGTVVVYAAALLVRRTSLWLSVLLAFTTVVASYVLGLSQQDYLASIVACLALIWWVGYAMGMPDSLLAFGYGFACVAATNGRGLGNVGWLVLVIGGAWGAGRALRSRRLLIDDLRQTTAELESSREELASRAVAEERLRIAREIHDVVAHSVTVMLVQAEAAERVMPEHPEARRAIVAVQESGRQAIAELRQLLGILRVDEARAGLAPLPSLDDLPTLVGQFREAGLEVTCAGEAPHLPANVGLTAYRVAQEALTNVLRHSRARCASLVLTAEQGSLVVEIADAGPARPAAGLPGHGLEGMRERVTACGGELEVGPFDAGFRVRATLPTTVPRPSTPAAAG